MDISQYPITLTTAQIKESSNKRYVNDFQIASINAIGTSQQLGGDLTGYLPNPSLNNLSVINQIINGFTSGPDSAVLNTDTILSAIQKLQAQISALPTYVAQEIPTGLINSTNTVFTLSQSVIVNSEMIFIQGILKFRGTDYTIETNTITFTIAPVTGSDVRVTYQY